MHSPLTRGGKGEPLFVSQHEEWMHFPQFRPAQHRGFSTLVFGLFFLYNPQMAHSRLWYVHEFLFPLPASSLLPRGLSCFVSPWYLPSGCLNFFPLLR